MKTTKTAKTAYIDSGIALKKIQARLAFKNHNIPGTSDFYMDALIQAVTLYTAASVKNDPDGMAQFMSNIEFWYKGLAREHFKSN